MNIAPKARSLSWSPWCRRAVLSALPLMILAVIPLAEPSGAAPPEVVSESPSALATSVQTAAGTWAAVPMGHLDQPLNTFWQLFFRASGTSSWSNATSTLAVATNGGLIIATPDGQSVEVGVRPANRLTFSTLLTGSPTQSSWTTGVLPSGLAADNSALATDALSGSSAALLNDGDDVRAVSSARGLSAWRTLTTEAVLASSPAGRHCGLRSITAVGFDGTQALIGGGCRHSGTVGIFSPSGDGWRLVGPSLPRELDARQRQRDQPETDERGNLDDSRGDICQRGHEPGRRLGRRRGSVERLWSLATELVTACVVHRTGERRWDVRPPHRNLADRSRRTSSGVRMSPGNCCRRCPGGPAPWRSARQMPSTPWSSRTRFSPTGSSRLALAAG